MAFWKSLWTLLWFGGLLLFAALSMVIIAKGAKDLRALLRGLREEMSAASEQEQSDA